MSYSWTIGVMIDQLFHKRLFFEREEEIRNSKSTSLLIVARYKFQDSKIMDIGKIIEKMIVKDKNYRLPLEEAKKEITLLQS